MYKALARTVLQENHSNKCNIEAEKFSENCMSLKEFSNITCSLTCNKLILIAQAFLQLLIYCMTENVMHVT